MPSSPLTLYSPTLSSLTLSLLLLALSSAVQGARLEGGLKPYVSQEESGLQIITLPSPYTLSFVANVQVIVDEQDDQYDSLLFTARTGSPNLYSATISGFESPSGFSAGPASVAGLETCAYVAYSSVNNVTAGIGLPNAMSESTFGIKGTMNLIQISLDTPTGPRVLQFQDPHYNFFGIKLWPIPGTSDEYYVYLVGWTLDPTVTTQGLVVARGRFNKATFLFTLDAEKDVIPPSKFKYEHCYDNYSAGSHPDIFVSEIPQPFLVVAVPGQCALIAKVELNGIDNTTSFNGAKVKNFDPTIDEKFSVSSYAFDSPTSLLWYTIALHRSSGATLASYDLIGLNSKVVSDVPVISNAQIALGAYTDDGQIVYVGAGGGTEIVQINTLRSTREGQLAATAPVRHLYSQFTSLVYSAPFLYWGTYEPNAKVIRLHEKNFCEMNCGANSYCELNKCQCQAGFERDSSSKEFTCAPNTVEVKKNIIRNQSATVGVLAVFLVFALILAAAGWAFWYRNKKVAAYQALN